MPFSRVRTSWSRGDSSSSGIRRCASHADTSEHDVDPFTKRSWPSSHAKRIDYRRGAPGDPKWIWELNRCQDLPVLAAAWLVSGSSRYGEAARERLLAWIESHPPGRGIAWSNGFEAGIRAISLAATIDAFRGSGVLSADEQAATLRALWQHARWIERDPSTGSSANNHRIGELAGLVVIGSLAPELVEGQRWLELGADELAREAQRQIRLDGTNIEQAFAYDVFVVDLLLVATAALDCAGRPVPAPSSMRSSVQETRSGRSSVVTSPCRPTAITTTAARSSSTAAAFGMHEERPVPSRRGSVTRAARSRPTASMPRLAGCSAAKARRRSRKSSRLSSPKVSSFPTEGSPSCGHVADAQCWTTVPTAVSALPPTRMRMR